MAKQSTILKISDIKSNIMRVAKKYDVKRVTLFGSYAKGKPTAKSDIDLLVEFSEPAVCLFTIFELQNDLQKSMNKRVEIVHGPIPKDSFLEIDKEVLLYGQNQR